MKRLLLFAFAVLLNFSSLRADESLFFSPSSFEEVPVAYQGRFREFSAYASLWWSDLYHSPKIPKKDRDALKASSAEEMAWKLHFLGHAAWDDIPVFQVKSGPIKELLGLPSVKNRFSYQDLERSAKTLPDKERSKDPLLLSELNPLLDRLRIFESLEAGLPSSERRYLSMVGTWQGQGLPPKKIAELSEERFPLRSRLLQAGDTMQMLPSRREQGRWYSLKALHVQSYDQKNGTLRPALNFTAYPDPLFEDIRKTYLNLDEAVRSQNQPQAIEEARKLGALLKEGYSSIAGTTFLRSESKSLDYPTVAQIRAEAFYYQAPLIEVSLLFYGFSLCGFLLAMRLKNYRVELASLALLIIAFVVHSVIIALRCYILGRPPVSNMFETVVYVPWIAVGLGLVLRNLLKTSIVCVAASFIAIALLVLLKVSNLSGQMENVQAVLDSQYWLTIHVMMIVGSYGVFALSGILSHFYIAGFLASGIESPRLKYLSVCILQTLYIGVALLIPGTILGGVWAAQSWGRFWDWDPKESWAFISSCVYLISVHAYRFRYIGNFGLASGSILGLMAISFTWYGVNYLLGTGLHSYGFGSGGDGFYYAYLLAETAFLCIGPFIFFLQKMERIRY